MIRRDRNHPSVIMWETTLNESWPPKSWKDQAVRIAHEEFPVINVTHRATPMDMMVSMYVIMIGRKDITVPIQLQNRDLSVNIMIMNLVVIIAPLA